MTGRAEQAGDRVGEIRARLAAATPGPWEVDGGGDIGQHWSRPEPWKPVVSTEVACGSYCYGGSAAGVANEEDAELIANAPADLAYLLAEVEGARAKLANVEAQHRKSTAGSEEPYCSSCFQKPYGYAPWPCPTIAALHPNQEGQS